MAKSKVVTAYRKISKASVRIRVQVITRLGIWDLKIKLMGSKGFEMLTPTFLDKYIPFHQEAILAAPTFVEDKTDQDIIERGLNINDVEVMRYENKVMLYPGPEKAVTLQPAYPESAEIKGCNSIEEDFQSGCDNDSSSNNKTGNLGLEDKSQSEKSEAF